MFRRCIGDRAAANALESSLSTIRKDRRIATLAGGFAGVTVSNEP